MPRLSRKNLKRVKRRSTKRRNLKGGNATSFPAEYFGGVNGSYSAVPPPNAPHQAYGDFVGQSFGEPFGVNSTGPNLFVSPGSSSIKTGGARKRSKRSKRSKRRRN